MTEIRPDTSRRVWLVLRPLLLLFLASSYLYLKKGELLSLVIGGGVWLYSLTILIAVLREPQKKIQINQAGEVIYGAQAYDLSHFYYTYEEFILGLRPGIALEEKCRLIIHERKSDQPVTTIPCSSFSQKDRDLLNRTAKKS